MPALAPVTSDIRTARSVIAAARAFARTLGLKQRIRPVAIRRLERSVTEHQSTDDTRRARNCLSGEEPANPAVIAGMLLRWAIRRAG